MALITDDVILAAVPPQSSNTSSVARSRPGAMYSGSTPRSKAVARIGDDAERAAGLGDVHRIPERRFDQHVGRPPRHSRNARRP